jgi:hypothetical protein
LFSGRWESTTSRTHQWHSRTEPSCWGNGVECAYKRQSSPCRWRKKY